MVVSFDFAVVLKTGELIYKVVLVDSTIEGDVPSVDLIFMEVVFSVRLKVVGLFELFAFD